MVQQLLSAGLVLSSIWEKARARDRQREVAGDKGQLSFVLQGMRPAAAQAAEWWQGAVLIRLFMNKWLVFYTRNFYKAFRKKANILIKKVTKLRITTGEIEMMVNAKP
jgi:hypothetical protein